MLLLTVLKGFISITKEMSCSVERGLNFSYHYFIERELYSYKSPENFLQFSLNSFCFGLTTISSNSEPFLLSLLLSLPSHLCLSFFLHVDKQVPIKPMPKIIHINNHIKTSTGRAIFGDHMQITIRDVIINGNNKSLVAVISLTCI